MDFDPSLIATIRAAGFNGGHAIRQLVMPMETSTHTARDGSLMTVVIDRWGQYEIYLDHRQGCGRE